MSIIDRTYFIGDVNLTKDQLDTVTASINDTSSWLGIYEEEVLKKLMGVVLYNAYITDLNGGAEPVEDRFKELVDGAQFSFEVYGQSTTKDWEGLRNKAKKKSLIAYYVYYKYRNEVENFNSNAGQATSDTENSERVSIYPKLVTTWNKMSALYGRLPEYLNSHKIAFLDTGIYSHFDAEPSAYNFLLANKETYPEWVFEPLPSQTLNIYGI